jgi:hypothetical protein
MSSKEGSEQIETLLRKVKATARTAGVSIKAMLGIIDSVKELAASNPKLQYMNSAATTNIAVNAVQKSAEMGMNMSAEEYRQAGGGKGIGAEQGKADLTFMQSGLGGFLGAALLKASGDPKKFKELSDLIGTGKVNQSYLQQGGMGEIAKILGMPVARLADMGTNTLMHQEAMRNQKVVDVLSGASSDIIGGSFFDMFKRTTGVDQKALEGKFAEYQKKGMTFEDFAGSEILPNLTASQQDFYRSYKIKIQEKFMESRMSEPEKQRLRKFRDQQIEEDKAFDKEHGGAYHPLTQQVLDVIAKRGKQSQSDITQGLVNIFATNEHMDPALQEATKKARESATKIANLAQDRTVSQEDLYNRDNIAGKISDVISARQLNAAKKAEKLRASGDTEGAKEYEERAQKLGGVSAEDIKQAQEYVPHLDYGEAQEALARLRKKKDSELTESDRQLKRGLLTYERAGLMENENAFNTAKKGGAAGFAAGVMTSEVESKKEEILEFKKNQKLDSLNFSLAEEAEKEGDSGTLHDVTNFYGKNTKKLMEDFTNNEGWFADEQHRKDFAAKKAGDMVNLTKSRIEEDRAEYNKKTEDTAGTQAKLQQDLVNSLSDLTKAITSGGTIGKALGDFATALKS